MSDAYSRPMTCEDVRRAVSRGAVLDDALAAHAEQCEACSELLAGGHRLGELLAGPAAGPAELPEGFREALDRALAGETGAAARLRERATPLRQMFAVASAALVIAVVAVALPRPDLAAYPAARLLLAATAFAAVLVLTVRLALRPPHDPRLPAWVERTLIATALLVPVLASALPAAHVEHAASLAGAGADLVPRALGCFFFGAVVALPVFLLLGVLDRYARRAIVPVVASAASIGLVANLALQLHCPLTHPAHLLLGHASIGIVAVIATLSIHRARNPR